MEDKKCQQKACHCSGTEVRADGYCSDSCKKGTMGGGKCSCAHAKCK